MICIGRKGNLALGYPVIRIKVKQGEYLKLSYVDMIYKGDDLSIYALPMIGPDCLSQWSES